MVFTHSKTYILGMAAGIFILMGCSSARADDAKVKKLTQANVKEFIENTTDLTTGNSRSLSPDKVRTYLEKHLENKAKFKSIMKYKIPGLPVQEAVLNLDKDGFMKSVVEGSESIEGYENLVEITEVKVASNGKKAFVKTASTEYASMAIPTETGGTENVPIEGVSECTQIISLNKGVIQMYSANCITNVEFLEY